MKATRQQIIKRAEAPIRMRNYGRIIQDMILVACEEQDDTKRHAMTLYIGQSMRQKNLIWNKDQESGYNRIQEDIRILSDGRLDTNFPEFEGAMNVRIGRQSNIVPSKDKSANDKDKLLTDKDTKDKKKKKEKREIASVKERL